MHARAGRGDRRVRGDGTGERTPTVSVVIPALNEGRFLPVLLDALAAQTHPPLEVVVADAHSVDDTVAVALRHGARVVAGGPPAVGRNAGASATTGDLLLFLDADARPGPDFLARALRDFTRRGLDVATASLVPLERAWDLRLTYLLVDPYLRVLARVSPHAVGACILVRRGVHERLGGFDEALALAEDHDYVRRGSRVGRFGVLRGVHIPVSMRRVLTGGRLRYAGIVLRSELRTLTGRPIRTLPPGLQLGGIAGAVGPSGGDRLRGWGRRLRRPSTELQGDALAAALVAGAAASVLALARSRALAVAAAAVAAASGIVALQPLRHERSYGRFFSATVATLDRDLRDASGELLARGGADAVCELHGVHHLRAMAALRRQGPTGRLRARAEIIEGLLALWDDFDDPRYRDVPLLTARAGAARTLRRVGFVEVPVPPRLDLANRLEKRLLALRIGDASGAGTKAPDCLVVMPRAAWRDPVTRAALQQWLDDVRAGLGGAEAAQ